MPGDIAALHSVVEAWPSHCSHGHKTVVHSAAHANAGAQRNIYMGGEQNNTYLKLEYVNGMSVRDQCINALEAVDQQTHLFIS